MDLKTCKKCKHIRYVSIDGVPFSNGHSCVKKNKYIEFVEPEECEFESNFWGRVIIVIVVGLLLFIFAQMM